MIRHTLFAALAVAVIGCGEERDTSPPPGRGLGTLPASPTGSAAPPGPPSRPAFSPRPQAPFEAPPPPSPTPSEGGPEQAPTSPRALRDLSAELRSSLGDPSGCLVETAGTEVRSQIDLVVTVQVVESGRVTRAEVTGNTLSREELRCVRERAEQVSFRGPVPEAPRTVSTPIELRWQAAPEGPG